MIRAEKFLPKVDKVIDENPSYQYPLYFKVKLYVALGRKDEALPVFFPFSKKKRNDFWVWEILAALNEDNRDLSFSSCCKADFKNT